MSFIFIKLIIISSFFLFGCATKNALLESSCQHDDDTFRCVKYIKNYDGDTIAFNIPNVHPLIGKNISIRLSGIDTPEIKSKNLCEKKMAKVAKKHVSEFMKKARSIELYKVKRGKYFRIVADVIVDGKSLKNELVNLKLAYPYRGDTKREINWCNVYTFSR